MEATKKSKKRWRLPASLAAVAGGAVLTAVLMAGPAAAATITFTGQGTNANGTCETFLAPDPNVPAGQQVWQFNLTQTMAGATMSATFSDGTTVTNKPEDSHTGKVSKWFITTAAGASVVSASASFTPDGENSQFVVSHCTAGSGEPPPTTTTTTTTTTLLVGGVSVTPPGGAEAVSAQPQFTG